MYILYCQFSENCHLICIASSSTSISAATLSAEAIAAAFWLIVVFLPRKIPLT